MGVVFGSPRAFLQSLSVGVLRRRTSWAYPAPNFITNFTIEKDWNYYFFNKVSRSYSDKTIIPEHLTDAKREYFTSAKGGFRKQKLLAMWEEGRRWRMGGGRVGALCCDVIRLSGTLTSRHRARCKADGDIMWRLYRATLRASSLARLLRSPSTAKTTFSLFALPTSIHIAFLWVSLSIIIHRFSRFLHISKHL